VVGEEGDARKMVRDGFYHHVTHGFASGSSQVDCGLAVWGIKVKFRRMGSRRGALLGKPL